MQQRIPLQEKPLRQPAIRSPKQEIRQENEHIDDDQLEHHRRGVNSARAGAGFSVVLAVLITHEDSAACGAERTNHSSGLNPATYPILGLVCYKGESAPRAATS